MTTSRLSAAGLVGLILMWAGTAFAQARADDAAERERISAERAAAEAAYGTQVQVCSSRFVVTSCVDAARAERHAALTALDKRQEVLDDAQRKQRAADRLQAIDSKVSGEEARRREEAARERSANRRDGAEPRPLGPPGSAAPPRAPKDPGDPAQRAEAEQRARRAYELKQLQAEAHRMDVLRRNQERARKANPGAPLPVPAASDVAAGLSAPAASAAR